MVWIPGGTFRMGSEERYPEERPVHRVTVDGFFMDRYPVTNERFARFVDATKHVTFAEIPPRAEDYPGALPEMLYAGSLVFIKPGGPVDLRQIGNWWHFLKGANWRQPQGPKSSLEGRERHPVVHVAFSDALAFALWGARSCRRKPNGSSPRAADFAVIRTFLNYFLERDVEKYEPHVETAAAEAT
jgi:formylglycine-generating enzyme required for sulfatase activity